MEKRIYYFPLLFGLFTCSLLFAQPTDNRYKFLDKHAKKAPKKLHQNFPALVDYLITPATSDFEKVRSFYTWITNNIGYDQEAYKNGNKRINRNIRDILDRRVAVCIGYATLFQAMCKRANLTTEVISGYSKGTLTSEPELEKVDHAWNAVKLSGSWYLLDATWGRSIQQKGDIFLLIQNEDYFLTTPDQFILTHLPGNPMWQLLDCPIPAERFKMNADSITSYLNQQEACFQFVDSIEQFMQLPKTGKLLHEAIRTYHFNPTSTNEIHLGHAYLSHAAQLTDQSEVYQENSLLDSLILHQQHIIQFFRKGKEMVTLYDWQVDLFANTLINQAVAFTRVPEDSRNSKKQPFYQKALNHLEEAKELLNSHPENPFSTQTIKQCNAYLELVQDYLKTP